jgi:hypothetical protein
VNQRRDHCWNCVRKDTTPDTLCELIPIYRCLGAELEALRCFPTEQSVEQARRWPIKLLFIFVFSELFKTNESKLSTTDLLVLASMKNAAKCDT